VTSDPPAPQRPEGERHPSEGGRHSPGGGLPARRKPTPTTRFSDRAEDYVKYRPSYPPEAIDAILAFLTPEDSASAQPTQASPPPSPPGGRASSPRSPSLGGRATTPGGRASSPRSSSYPPLKAADVGAGPGISARLLADRGLHVYAIEPNAAMRQAGARAATVRERTSPAAHPQSPPASITWIDAPAEATTLPDASVDLVLCAQAYHWFEGPDACREFARILKPRGALALLWNDGDESTPVARGYYDLIRRHQLGEGPTTHQRMANDPVIHPPFPSARKLHFRNVQRLDADGLVGRAMSASYVSRSGPAAEALVTGLRRLHAEHADDQGLVSLEYDVWLYLARARLVRA